MEQNPNNTTLMKKHFPFYFAAFMTLMYVSVNMDAQDLRLREDNIPEILQALTLEEKASLVVGGGMKSMMAGTLGEKGVLVPGAGGTIRPIERLGIPSAVLSDGPAGVRIEPLRKRDKGKTFFATAFPSGTLLASTWNEDIVRKVGQDLGNEALEYGIDVMLGPGMNLHRNPLNGRNFEYYSEDPVVTGKIAAAMIRGMQSNGVGACAKHYALNSQEACRNGNDARADERTIRELYLKGFEIAVKEAAPWTIMSSYNRVNGVWAQSNHWLLTDILRDEWGFDGIVMSDWTGKRNTAEQVAAGNDLMEPGYKSQKKEIIRKVKSGELSEADLDACVERILQFIVKTPRFKGYVYSDAPDLEAHAKTARSAAAEGIVLLKNDGSLPLRGVTRIALFGNTGYKTVAGGTGSGNVHAPYVVNISEALAATGFHLDADIENAYQAYLKKKTKKGGFLAQMLGKSLPKEMEIPDALIRPEKADAALFVIGRQAGEGLDRHIEDDFLLTAAEKAHLEKVHAAFHAQGKPVIVILNTGGAMETASWDSLCDALVALWQPGEEGASALADILSGAVNPSGKLTMTFPLDYMDIPSSSHFPYDYKGSSSMNTMKKYKDKGKENIDFTEFAEGLNVGYRYFCTSGKPVAYPFGFGLSYTTFSYDSLVASRAEDGTVKVSLRVTNTGDVAGKEVVQVYVNDPAPTFFKPELELKAFAKTSLLAPGASEVLEMTIAPYILASFNESTSAWEISARMNILAGASAGDIRLTVEL
jgi:beta-glucosidase